ncbi:unnamed protein product [Rotaria magnacalcarata]|uniref:PH domain-containing protein n=5 Tax=Rotaria magnacalcarata TaxID=392030 RepID=A0A816FZJ5_9BILA|nr:unnamed protein product [Rotaria magnacalcarata]CAF1667786.1 unnamed protein product [Rotaria magnacalcarata]CAF2055333.1 unnamed protein product [Rotaria magnacalcarata]CAF2221167.1 unnamed protein product [Rotaria magnacalcarata]
MSEIKRGMLKYYHRGLLSKKWKEYKFVLYDSSLLTWFSDVKHKKPDGMVLLKDVERHICVGPYTRFLPDFPHLDNIYDEVALIAFPMSVKDRDRDIVWLLCDDLDDLNSWMKAIVETLPSRSLHTEKMSNPSAPYIDEDVQTTSDENSSENDNTEAKLITTDTMALPLSAGLIATHLQGRAMRSKTNPLEKAGYDYGSNEWGTGDGWGYSSSDTVPGFAGIGGSGAYANHIDLIRDEEDEKQLDNVGSDEAVETVTYELSKNEIQDEEEIPHYCINTIDAHDD